MTPGDGSSPTEPGRRESIEDLAFLLLAVLIVVLPALLRSTPGGPVEIEERSLPPASIRANSAPWYEWMLLDGIGEARARKIVEHRAEHGPFRSIEDLRAVPGMPPGWPEVARGSVTFEDDDGGLR